MYGRMYGREQTAGPHSHAMCSFPCSFRCGNDDMCNVCQNGHVRCSPWSHGRPAAAG